MLKYLLNSPWANKMMSLSPQTNDKPIISLATNSDGLKETGANRLVSVVKVHYSEEHSCDSDYSLP